MLRRFARGMLVAVGAWIPVLAAPAQARGFERILWVNASVRADAEFYAAVSKLGFTAVSVSADQDPAVPGKHGLRFYRDQVAGKGILELRQADWDQVQKAYDEQRDPTILVRPTCLSEPGTIETLRGETEKRLAAALPHEPLAVSLGDEIAVTRHANPLDLCFSPSCLRAFRRFVATRHPTVEALNRAWGTAFVEMQDVTPFTADRIRARELGGVEIPVNLRPWAEHLEFRDRQFARVVGGVARLVAASGPSIPRGLTGMQPPSAYGGHDYRRLMPFSTFYEAYDIGGARDLAMSFAPPRALQVATLFAPGEGEPAEYVSARCFDMVAHGMAGTVVWSAQQVFDADGVATAYGRQLGDAAKWLDRAGVAAGAELLRAPVWIVESQASVRAHWMLDSAADGRTWVRRLSSYERGHSTSLAARHAWLRLFEDLGLQPRFVAAGDLATELRAGPPRLLVLPALLAVSNDEAVAIANYVAEGGVALADHGLGLYDEFLQRRDGGVLDPLFGVRGRSLAWRDTLVRQGVADDRGRAAAGGAAVAEVAVHGELAEPVGPFHVHIERKHGRGKAVYLNLAVCEYGRARLDPERLATALELRRRVRGIAWDAGIRPPVEIVGEGLPTCIERMLLRARTGARLLAVRLNAMESPALMSQLGERGPRVVRLVFPAPVRLVNVLSGRESGPATEFEMQLGPWVGLLFEVREAE